MCDQESTIEQWVPLKLLTSDPSGIRATVDMFSVLVVGSNTEQGCQNLEVRFKPGNDGEFMAHGIFENEAMKLAHFRYEHFQVCELYGCMIRLSIESWCTLK